MGTSINRVVMLFLLVLPVCMAIRPAHGSDIDPRRLPVAVRLVLSKVQPLLAHKQYQKAADLLESFQARSKTVAAPGQPDPKGYHHPEIYFAMGNAYLLQAKHTAAAAAYEAAVSRETGHSFAWLNLAKARYELGQFAEAGRCFGKGYDSAAEKQPQTLYYSAAAYLMGQEAHKAIACFQQLLQTHRADIKLEWKETYVHALLATDQARVALAHIRELASTYGGEKQLQWQEILLHQYLQLEMTADALTFALKLTRNAPHVAKWWKALAHIQLNLDQHVDALAALTIYSFQVPLSDSEKQLLADLNLQVGIPIKAAPLYEELLQGEADDPPLQRLVMAYRQLGRPEAALAHLEAADGHALDAALLLLKGELLFSLKRYAEAAESCRRSAKHNHRQEGRAWLMAGYAAWQLNDIPGSRDAFSRAVQHRQSKKAARAALRELSRATVQ